MKKKILLYMLASALVFASCKAKKCPTYDGDNGNHKVKYNKKGLVKKKK